MKKLLFLFACTLCICGYATAQAKSQNKKVPAWVSDKGFWVVEDNINTPGQTSVYFYNNDNELVYQQQLTGTKLKLQKKKVLVSLKQALETSVTAWAQKKKNGDTAAMPMLVITKNGVKN